MDITELLEKELQSVKEGKELAVATIVSSDGGTTRTSGKMLVYADGSISGTIGGGSVERACIADALQCLAEDRNAVKVYDYNTGSAEAGASCGGKLTVFIESCRSRRPQLVMIGGGHVGTALMRAAHLAGFFITLVDTRGEEQIGEAIALADRFCPVEDFRSGAAALPMAPNAFYVVATFGHAFDGEALVGALTHEDAAYIGMIGSHRKIKMIFDKLLAEGISQEKLDAVHSPIGLDLGGETPEEIAVAILAELLMVKNHGTASAKK